ncbi:Nif3-like dinuclear metal center hexameric protein [Mucilaginibacter sp.]|uniref:Nif3-like dinuclear metal center hexameric protein n=1 Tax=Mucilaginibacter sp. TaxID=1882438 RepID=UPI002842A01A|nr:Nif3-like dinuclear metal center hexameric protein [Mucilaginibacter sp.]MDR3694397.1 Nif3-like dinuclear metal center hexameric protein [Mucilaginibacter sp.]
MKPVTERAGSFAGYNRRKFIYNVSTAVGAGLILSSPIAGLAAEPEKKEETYTVKQIMDLFIKDVPGGVLSETVDTLKAGSPDTKVTGIVTTMFATIAVIRNAIDLGANFIIAHEPTFYNHEDKTDWLQDDKVYRYKANLLKEHNIAVWRNHDYIHHLVPDGVTMGVLDQLGWQKYADKDLPNRVNIPAIPLKELIRHTKAKLNIEKVRYMGDPLQKCSKVLLLPGAAGGRTQIESIEKYRPDVLMAGEISEWETAEYVRDALAKGDNLSLIVLGHIASEEPGSEYMLTWLKKNVPGVKATHVPSGHSLTYM